MPYASLSMMTHQEKWLTKKCTDQELIRQLKESGVAFSETDIVFITKDATGQIVWLETGNEGAGLTHIVKRHMGDFANAIGLTEAELPVF